MVAFEEEQAIKKKLYFCMGCGELHGCDTFSRCSGCSNRERIACLDMLAVQNEYSGKCHKCESRPKLYLV